MSNYLKICLGKIRSFEKESVETNVTLVKVGKM